MRIVKVVHLDKLWITITWLQLHVLSSMKHFSIFLLILHLCFSAICARSSAVWFNKIRHKTEF